MDKWLKNLFLTILIALAGCASVSEPVKVLWGSSTRALEKARAEALTKAFHCTFDDCFDAVLSLARPVEDSELSTTPIIRNPGASTADPVDSKTPKPVVPEGYFDVFIKDRVKGLIVVMGIKGNVNTTEVGIFFSEIAHHTVNIEVSSLSSSAKRKISELVFDKLGLRFNQVQ